MAWALARQEGRPVLMRIDDLDGPRVKPGAERDALDMLAWLGLDWDATEQHGPLLRQSDDLSPYIDAMRALAQRGAAYPCAMSRKEILAALSAPQHTGTTPGETATGSTGEIRFPPELRPDHANTPKPFEPDDTPWRFATPPDEVTINDRFAGTHTISPADTVGDFPIWTGHAPPTGQPAYQLACLVDDARTGVAQIVRGDDLLDSAARQTLLARALGLEFSPEWVHLPLVTGPDGRRLAKRHGDTRIDTYRASGVTPHRLIALLARWSGIELGDQQQMSAAEFVSRFRLDTMPRHPIRFTEDDDTWLRAGH